MRVDLLCVRNFLASPSDNPIPFSPSKFFILHVSRLFAYFK
jgi:hypothetical protein